MKVPVYKVNRRRSSASGSKQTPENVMIEVDLRAIPSGQHYPNVLAIFDSLADGRELRITSEYEPRPLRSELERTRSGQYVWLQHSLGQDLWEVTLRRVTSVRTQEVRDFLRRCPLFADASAASVHAMEAVAIEKVLAHGEAAVEQETDWDAFGLVLNGSLAAMITSPLGREHALYDVLSCEPFGEIAITGRGPTTARFVATSHSACVLIFPKPVICSILNSDFAVSQAMNDHLAQRMRTMIEHFAAQTSFPTVARVAAALLPHATPDAGLQPVLPTLANLTQVELAAAAGTVKEIVSRALAELENGGAIQRSGGRIVKLNRLRLTSYAKRQ